METEEVKKSTIRVPIIKYKTFASSEELGNIFLKNLFLNCFWWALRNKEFDFFNF